MLVDSHCHLDKLDLSQHDNKLENVLVAAYQNEVRHILCPGVLLTDFPNILDIIETYVDENQYPKINCAVALHPSEKVDAEPTVEDIVELAKHPKVIAIGETGLDYYYDFTDQALQIERLRRHIKAAIDVNKPLILHMRDATDDMFKVLKEEGAEKVKGVMHCFTADWDAAKRAIDLGFYIGFSGIVTFKNALTLKEVAKQVPLDRILIETDAPYLSPVPVRSKPNEPAYVRYTAEYLAELKQVSFDEFAHQTTQNFYHLFFKNS